VARDDGDVGVAEDMIAYEQLMQDALRTVVRSALQQATGPRGIPGKHHFYITFRTRAPGVGLADHLRARYPEEMTIVLEHQFWDLEVFPDRFRVILKFSGQPQPITVPFAAITRFFDPSVKFGLQFEQHLDETRMASGDDAGTGHVQSMAAPEPRSSDAAGVISLDAFRKK
jgi:hypothetical protein